MENITTEIVQSTTEKGNQAQLTCVGKNMIFSIGDEEYTVDLKLVSRKIFNHLRKISGK